MGNEVVLIGRAELDSIYQSLNKMRESANQGLREVGTLGKKTQDNLDRTTKKTEQGIKMTGNMLRRLASSLYSDFKALMSLNAISGALKLSNQFKGAISESISLSDTIRRLGGSFGIARGDFGKFQADLSRGLGDIGASSEAAAEAIEGLAGLGVKGQASVRNLAKGAVTLTGMSGEKGNERAVSGLLGSVLRAQGKDVNDVRAQQALIGEVTAAVQTTGKKSSEILGAMDQIFSTMDQKLRGSIGPQAMAQMATIAATVGPSATKAMQEYLSKSAIERLPMEQQGVKFFGKDGQINIKELTKFIKTSQQRIGMDPRKALQTFGFSEEAADGLLRIGQQSDEVTSNLDKLSKATRDNEAAFRSSMGFIDSFKGSINTLKGRLEEFTSGWTKSLTDMLSNQVGDVKGSAMVVGGGAALAAILAGFGLKGIGGALAKGALAGELTGKGVQPVYVTNIAELAATNAASTLPGLLGKLPTTGGIGGPEGLLPEAGGAAAKTGRLGSLAKGAAGVAAAVAPVAAAAGAGLAIGYGISQTKTGNDAAVAFGEKFGIQTLLEKLDNVTDGLLSGNQKVQVNVETKEPNLRPSTKPGRGASN